MKDPLCKSGCYMFADGAERTACENSCRMARRAGHVDPHALRSGAIIRRLLLSSVHLGPEPADVTARTAGLTRSKE